MNVLFFFTSNFPYDSGETFIENEIQYLSNSFDKIVIISNSTTKNQTRDIPDNCILYTLPYNLSFTQKLRSISSITNPKFWKERNIIKSHYKLRLSKIILFTILHCITKSKLLGSNIRKIIQTESNTEDKAYLYSYWTNDVAYTLSQLKPLPQIKKTISRAHRWDIYFEENTAKYLPFRTEIFNNTDGVYFISENGKSYYKNLFPKFNNKYFVSKLGVQKQVLKIDTVSDTFKLVSCSNVISVKRVHKIVEALSLIQDISIHWTHFGDGPLFDEIKNIYSTKLNNKSNITYTLEGRKTNQEVLDFYSKNYVDAFINVSSSEGIPVSIMEAMSFGIPCIATNVGGNSEIVNESNGILLSTEGNAIEIIAAIEKIRSGIIKREDVYSFWKANYSADKNYPEFIQLLITK